MGVTAHSRSEVYTTEYGTEGNVKTVVVKKTLHVLDQEEKKLFFKEAAPLNGLLHPQHCETACSVPSTTGDNA